MVTFLNFLLGSRSTQSDSQRVHLLQSKPNLARSHHQLLQSHGRRTLQIFSTINTLSTGCIPFELTRSIIAIISSLERLIFIGFNPRKPAVLDKSLVALANSQPAAFLSMPHPQVNYYSAVLWPEPGSHPYSQ